MPNPATRVYKLATHECYSVIRKEKLTRGQGENLRLLKGTAISTLLGSTHESIPYMLLGQLFFISHTHHLYQIVNYRLARPNSGRASHSQFLGFEVRLKSAALTAKYGCTLLEYR